MYTIQCIQLMSCHYSCQSCSGATYLYLCTNCPSTRTLIGTSCECSPTFRQGQVPTCTPTSSLEQQTETLLTIGQIFYYSNIVFIWLYVMVSLCKVYYPKLRITINLAQVTSLTLFYPFRMAAVGEDSLKALGSLNFHFMTDIICTRAGPPYHCQFYQNLIGPALLIPMFLLCFLLSFVILHCCFKPPVLSEPLTLSLFWKISRLPLLFHIIDITITYWAVSFTRVLILSFWAFIIMGFFLLLFVLVMRYMYLILNSSKQLQLEHRIKYGWAYLYDQNYSYHYIDHLYEIEKEKHKKNKEYSDESSLTKPFTPHSNFLFFQILFKFLSGAFVVLLYEYKPALMAYMLVLLLLVQMCLFGVFCIYQRSDLLLYIFLLAVYVMTISTFWLPYYDVVCFVVCALYAMLLLSFFILLIFAYKNPSPKILARVFEDGDSEYGVRSDVEKSSEDELVLNRSLEISTDGQRQQWYEKKSSRLRQSQIEANLSGSND